MKEKLLNFIKAHPTFSKSCFRVYNRLNAKNQFWNKGTLLVSGNSLLNGIKIKSHGENNKVVIGDFVKASYAS